MEQDTFILAVRLKEIISCKSLDKLVVRASIVFNEFF